MRTMADYNAALKWQQQADINAQKIADRAATRAELADPLRVEKELVRRHQNGDVLHARASAGGGAYNRSKAEIAADEARYQEALAKLAQHGGAA